ncbi:amino acid adenylation domain-containing protein [Tumebacillus sp. ITR2]|uniref:Amino acid adenylation domain-containing protein n=1 Tax=Tumebacillus amylolyticus TaxID=2801339 RepID=A0ABS1JGI1_9BACL|nr:non-ribosomal peptide synthetase [Tumebacillus amylolyticus]MBL0388693.1 amino acid adenylation domain-containing protein [Tumebacillus amylolyticus]
MSNLQQQSYAISRGREYAGWETSPKTLPQALKRAVERGRGIVHVKADGSEVYQSYADLLDSAERVLGALRARGLQPHDKVIVEVQDSHLFLSVFWGCILGGFTCAPMHTPASFEPESNQMRKTKNVWKLLDEPLLVCDGFLESKYLNLQEHPLYAGLRLVTAETLLNHERDGHHHPSLPEDLAFLQFSSGSTGNAKGVELTHGNIMYNCGSQSEAYGFNEHDVFVNWMPLYHDMGLIGLHLHSLFHGSQQLKMSHETFVRRPELLLKKITEHGGTITGSPNFGLEWMTAKVNDLSELDLSTLRAMINGAEPISVQVTQRFQEKFARAGLREGAVFYTYGMAEACVGVAVAPCGEMQNDLFHRIDQKLFNSKGLVVPVTDLDTPYLEMADEGIPLPGMELRVVDDRDQVLPESRVGHIQIKGPNVTRGYYRNPEANANLFCDGWLRTGDLGFLLNGRLVVTGRNKDIIFINGQNFYAHDVEELVIREFDLQNQTVVAVGMTEQGSGRERVYLFLKYKRINDQFLKLSQDLKTTINVELGFEIEGVIPVQAIPKTTSGKLERYNLRARLIEGEFDELLDDIRLKLLEKSSTRNDLIMPRTAMEKILHKLWTRVLGHLPGSVISVNDHFMALGGNSLKAMQLLRDVEETLGVQGFELSKLFECPTIESLATYLEHLQAAQAEVAAGSHDLALQTRESIRESVLRLQAEGQRAEYELSHGQRGLWFIQQMTPNSVAYNEHYLLKLTGRLDVLTFGLALREIIERHAILRTVFVERGGRPKQLILDEVTFELPLFDAVDMTEEQVQAVVEEALFEDLSTPFDLTQEPLFRFKLFQIGETEFRFYIVTHHILIDGLSIDVLFRELSTVYSAKAEDLPFYLPPVEVQYAEFAEWQQEQMDTPRFQRMEEYWVERLAKPLPVLELPTDFPRPPRLSNEGSIVNHPLSPELTQALKSLSEQTNTSLYMVMLAAYFVWLHRVTHDEDLIVGTPFNGRTEPEIQELIGYFVNTMPIRVNMEGVVTFQDMLNQVRLRLLEALEHQAYPFDLLTEKSNLDRDPSRPVLYSTLFNFLIPPTAKMNGLELELMDSRKISSISDLTWIALLKDEHLHLDVEFNTTLFKPDTVRRFLGQFETILRTIADDPDAPVRMVDILTVEDRTIYERLNDVKTWYPADKTLDTLFYEAAEEFAANLALSSDEVQYTYTELNERSNQVAHLLRAQGLKKGEFVAIFMERSPETVISALGIIKAGGAYVPIDPEYPADRNRYVLEDCSARFVLTTRESMEKVNEMVAGNGTPPTVYNVQTDPDGQPTHNLDVQVTPDDLAYVIYTSGSTGRPKGVLIEHRGVVNLCVWGRDAHQLTERDVCLEFASYSFDVSVLETFCPLFYGARLHILSNSQRLSIEEFADAVERVEGTLLMILPVVFFKHLATYLRDEDFRKLRTLRQINTAGEALTGEIVRLWQRRFGLGIVIGNGYGPTEATVLSTFHAVTTPVPEDRANIQIGAPLSNYETYILNAFLQPCPVNVPGELCIGGLALAREYLNQPEKTAEVFIPHPFSDDPNARLYRSGDICKLLPDGTIEYLGRKDAQVKVRGYRIEIGEIEDAFAKQPNVQEVAVIAKADGDGTKRLLAFYTTVSGEAMELDDIRAFLGTRLPDFMIPEGITYLDEMPLTPSGKMDRKALAALETYVQVAQRPYAAPENSEQRILADAWRDVLEVERVGIHDDFFEMGGHSLKILKVLVLLKPHFPTLRVQDFFLHHTIAEMDHALREQKGKRSFQRGARAKTRILGEEKTFANFPANALVTDSFKTVLLTGATGYLGAHILHELYEKTDAHILCLVRPSETVGVQERLDEILRFYFGDETAQLMALRLTVLAGDLAKVGLGLSAEDAAYLDQHVDAIIHSGADVRHYGDVEHFDQVNVEGTRQLLDIARRRPGVRFHHVSTMTVLEASPEDEYGQAVLENVYVASKLRAEELVREAIEEGIPCTVFRAGNLIGHSKTGKFQRNIDSNAFYRMIRALLLLKAAPDVRSFIDLTPIDYAAAALVNLAQRRETVGRAIHLCNWEQSSHTSMIQLLQSFGYHISLLHPQAYQDFLFRESHTQNDTLQLIIAQMEGDGPRETPVKFSCIETQLLLQGTDVTCAKPDPLLLFNMVKYAMSIGYFPQNRHYDALAGADKRNESRFISHVLTAGGSTTNSSATI